MSHALLYCFTLRVWNHCKAIDWVGYYSPAPFKSTDARKDFPFPRYGGLVPASNGHKTDGRPGLLHWPYFLVDVLTSYMSAIITIKQARLCAQGRKKIPYCVWLYSSRPFPAILGGNEKENQIKKKHSVRRITGLSLSRWSSGWSTHRHLDYAGRSIKIKMRGTCVPPICSVLDCATSSAHSIQLSNSSLPDTTSLFG